MTKVSLAVRQPTPSDSVGILSNGNVRLDERLDLVDFLEDIKTSGQPHTLPVGGVSSWESKDRGPAHNRALRLALQAESSEALSTLQDDIPPIAPAWCQALFCLCFPVIGVEGTMRSLKGFIPDAPGKQVARCLQAIDAERQHQDFSSGRRRKKT